VNGGKLQAQPFQELAGRLAKAGQVGDAMGIIKQTLALAADSVDLKVDLARLCLQANDRVRQSA
jgi:thioredoxin-like negative regulator of GroEL